MEQSLILKNSLKSYLEYAKEILLLRNRDNWNISNYLFIMYAMPLEKKINLEFDLISEYETKKAKDAAELINSISAIIPWLTFFLLFLMLFLAYRLAKKGSRAFIRPVIELEVQDKLKSDLALLSKKVESTYNINQFSNNLIREICIKTGAQSGLFFIAKEGDKYLELSASYALSKNEKVSIIQAGEGLIGQVFIENEGIEI